MTRNSTNEDAVRKLTLVIGHMMMMVMMMMMMTMMTMMMIMMMMMMMMVMMTGRWRRRCNA